MKTKIIEAALREMEIHSLKFTMEDLTRRLRIGRNSLYKIMPSKEDVVKSTIEYKITYFTEKESEILSGADDADLKIKSILQLYANTFGVIGNHIGTDLQIMYPKVWDIWQEFHRLTIHKVIELIKSSADEGFYRNLNLNVVEELLVILFSSMGSSAFLNRTNFSYKEAVETIGDVVLYGLKKR